MDVDGRLFVLFRRWKSYDKYHTLRKFNVPLPVVHVLPIFNPQSDRDFSFTKGDENYLEEWRASRRAYNPLNLTDRLIII